MKVKVINRSEASMTRERSEDVMQVHRNLDPTLHPFERAREYTRALNAAKTERVFAKPFIGALPHDEAVYCIARSPTRLNCVLAGCGDGMVKLWDVPGKRYVPAIHVYLVLSVHTVAGAWPLCQAQATSLTPSLGTDVSATSQGTLER